MACICNTVSTDADVTIDHVGSLENAATVISRLHRGEKRLVFCDSRSSAEQLSSMLRAKDALHSRGLDRGSAGSAPSCNDLRCGEKVAFEDKYLQTVMGTIVRIN